MVESQWGPVHLFDVSLRCDHLGMALALAAHGVPGCVLEVHHLGPFCTDSTDLPCRNYQGWNTCHYCCWAFPVEQGIWMEDWDEAIVDSDDEADEDFGAIPAAQEAAATPITRAMLDICSCEGELPFSGSPKAMARLLDIAILTGNQKATVNLAKKSQLRPLRRWAFNWKFKDCWIAARTALWAGADFQDLMVKNDFAGSLEEVPFPQALFLKSFENWQDVRHMLPGGHDLWRPRNLDNHLGRFFLERPPGCCKKLSLDKIRAAEDAGLDLQSFSVRAGGLNRGYRSDFVTLLDLAIWCGQPDCAEVCVDGGIELMGDDMTLAWHKQVLHGESLRLLIPNGNRDFGVVPSEAQTGAAAAGRAWLKRGLKSESSQKGIALYQFMLKMFKGRSFPMVLVQEILTFSMPVPKIIDQLDLWEHVGDWMAAICGRPASEHPVAAGNTANVEDRKGMQDTDEAGALLYIEVYFFCHCLLPRVEIASGNHSWEPYITPFIARFVPTSMIHSKRPWNGICTTHMFAENKTLQKYRRSHFRNNKFRPDKHLPIHCSIPKFSLHFSGFPTTPSHVLRRGATSGDAIETDVKATEDLMTALRASRDQVPALNVDGVCLCLWFSNLFDKLLWGWWCCLKTLKNQIWRSC